MYMAVAINAAEGMSLTPARTRLMFMVTELSAGTMDTRKRSLFGNLAGLYMRSEYMDMSPPFPE